MARPVNFSSLSLSLSLSAFGAVNTVSAQYANPNTRYIVIPTGVDPSCSFRADYVPTSLNDCGDMVGYTFGSPTPGCVRSPWIWSLCGRFGLSPQSKVLLNDLSTSSGPVPSGEGRAWSINNDGDVAGEQTLDGGSFRVPFVWRFGATGLASAYAVGPTDSPGVLRGVSESSSTIAAHVVGTRATSNNSTSRAMYHVLGAAPGTITDLTGLPATNQSAGFAAARTLDSTAVRFGGASAGTAGEAGFTEACSTCPSAPTDPFGNGTPLLLCDASGPVDGVRWSTATGAAGSGVFELSTTNTRIYGIDGLNRAVGTYRDADLICNDRAGFWQADGTRVALGLVSPLNVDTESEAFAIAPAVSGGSTLVGGRERAFFDSGAVWWRANGTAAWTATLLAEMRLSTCDYFVRSVVDVNAKGWLAALGQNKTTQKLAGLLMIPYDCPLDIDFNGSVGASDIAVLLGAWGPCPLATCPCSADLNNDGIVDAVDLGILQGAWGTTCSVDVCTGCVQGFESQAEQLLGGGSIDVPLEVIHGMSGQPDAAAFAAWVTELSTEQRLAFAASIAALSGQEGGTQ